jgi:glycosidase
LNILSTHDTERILTVLGGELDDGRYTNSERRTLRMPKEALERAKDRLKMAAAIQFTVFGVPSVFYGDEAGMEGYHDPFCRRPYPWGREDSDLLDFYRTLGAFRRESAVLARGEFALLPTPADAIAYQRGEGKGAVILVANRGEKPLYFALPNGKWRAMGSKKAVSREICLAPDTFFLARRV